MLFGAMQRKGAMLMSLSEYSEAWKKGTREAHLLHIQDKDPYLPVLAEIIPEINRMAQVPLGICPVPLEFIVGTVTKGRTNAFSRSFYHLLEPNTEFANKWADLYDSVLESGLNQPIKAYEYYNQFYVVEGNKRVSVMRQLDALSIEADVTRILPEKEDSVRYRVYNEFLSFYKDTKADYVLFTREGSYDRLRALTGHEAGKPWSEDDLHDLHSCFYRFQQAFKEKKDTSRTLTPSDAFLLYLDIFPFPEAVKKTPSEISQDIDKIRAEYTVAASGKPAALLSQTPDEKPGLIQSVLHRPPKNIKCAFLYNSAPERSGWTYWHELARKAVDESLGTQVETLAVPNISMDEAGATMERLIAEGYTTIFATSPVFLDACIHTSATHPEARILNCSLLASYHNVRSYYLRIYEAKFVLGAIAGAMADNNKIGYIADYPIYGVPASINAFAIGAQMTNPRAEVYVDWSTLPDHIPEKALAEKGITIISSRDISAPYLENRSFGLYEYKNEQTQNLAMPVWNWIKVYEGILRSILNGAWAEDADKHPDRALNYYMGMSTDAIDLFLSSKIPPRLKRLVDLLHERIRSESFLPFLGPLYDQGGLLRIEQNVALTPQDIISMDYLASNVTGTIPTIQQLTPAARSLVALQGIRAATQVERKDEK